MLSVVTRSIIFTVDSVLDGVLGVEILVDVFVR